MKPIDSMDTEELFTEAIRLRKEMVTTAEKLNQVCGALYLKVRRSPSDQSSIFVSISNANRRFAGSVTQGAKRTAAVDRILAVSKRAAQEEQERKERQEEWEKRRALARLQRETARSNRDSYGIFGSSNQELVIEDLLESGAPVSDLNDLYGDE